MRVMRTLIVDDEPIARQILREQLSEIAGVEIAGEASSGAEALRQISATHPDVVLLDIEMPGLKGFGVLQSLRGERPAVIFVTAYQEHALKAFEVGAIDYLLKPVRKERLEASLEKARKQMPPEPPAPVTSASPQAVVQSPRKIVGKSGADFVMIDLADIVAFQADGDTVYIVTANRKYVATHPLKAIEEKLPPPHFRRIHRKTIINTDHIRRISPLSSKRWLLSMSNGMEAIVSKRMAGAIREETRW